MQKTYTRKINSDRLWISADLTQASAPILLSWDGPDEMRSTPFQTADARHNLDEAFRLCKNYQY